MRAALEEDGQDESEEEAAAFPRLGDGPTTRPAVEGEILLRVHQRRAGERSGFEVLTSPEGEREIPMAVAATTVGSWLPRGVVLRSPWLARCLEAPEGASVTRAVALDAEEPAEEDWGSSADGAVMCHRVARSVLELALPAQGACQLLLPPKGVLQCLDLCGPGPPASDLATTPGPQLLALFTWAAVLELDSLAAACREALLQGLDTTTVALALAAGRAARDAGLLRSCYWCLREALCGAAGAPAAWLDGRGPVRLQRGALCHGSLCRTPLRALSLVLEEDLAGKRERWLTATDCYTLCQLRRFRGPSGAYPHRYELRLDHSEELLLTALREDEQGTCRIFAGEAVGEASSEHCEAFLGQVVPNFWGTAFCLYDSGADLEALTRRAPAAASLPLRQRECLCRVGYETNILGDCPRKVTVDFNRGKAHHHMENMAPRWDKKLNSYALPFFGRVKKASAKNFQLVVDNDPNTIFLMFGKISKDVFCLDFRGPLAHLDAMAIALAALAKKRAVS